MGTLNLYYSAIIYMTIASLLVLHLQIRKNEILSREEKKGFLITLWIIITVALAEWLGVVLNGQPSAFIPLHRLVKCIEFSIAPFVPVTLIHLFRGKGDGKLVFIPFVANAVLEVLSFPMGFIYYIDAGNVYQRGSFYWIYMAFYLWGLILFSVQMARLSRQYQNQNMATLVGIVIFMVSGLAFQSVNREVRTSLLGIAVGFELLYAHYSNMMLQLDSLTALLSRGCYEKCLERLRYRTAILLFDVDDFKEINDTYGHPCGDEVLKTIASVIRKAYARIGCCYRIGGDEFCVILNRGRLDELPDSMEEYIHPETGEIMEMAAPPSSLQFINGTFDRFLREARQANPILPEVSLGYVFYDGKEDLDRVIKQADELMYQKKQIRKANRRREKKS